VVKPDSRRLGLVYTGTRTCAHFLTVREIEAVLEIHLERGRALLDELRERRDNVRINR